VELFKLWVPVVEYGADKGIGAYMRNNPLLLVAAAVVLLSSPGCKSTGNGGPDAGKDGYRGESGMPEAGGDARLQSPFSYNGEMCESLGLPLSAVTSHVDVTMELLDLYAERLQAEGFEVFRGPEKPDLPEPEAFPDVISQPADVRIRDVMYNGDYHYHPDIHGDADVHGEDSLAQPDRVEQPDVATEPEWTGGEYLIARTQLSDLVFVLETGTIGAASWCPAHSLGQIRRLDYALAEAVRLWADTNVASYDYVKETDVWSLPNAYYTAVEANFQRTYMNESLDSKEAHTGKLSVSGKPVMTAFGIYGHADAPSAVGDRVGMDLLQIGQAVVEENYSDTLTGQVVQMWNITNFVGEGENSILVDGFVSDAGLDWQVGVYHFFAEVIFPETVHGSFVMHLQGAPPGKLLSSKPIETLVLPPLAPLF